MIAVALVQLDVQTGDPRHNIDRASGLVAEAASGGAQLVSLPELWASGYALDRASELADVFGHGAFSTMERLAQEHGVFLSGSLLEVDHDRVYNTHVVCSPDGRTPGRYRKTHLFGLMDEPRFLTAGEEPVACDVLDARVGLGICYDLRFPALFAAYGDEHCDVLLICAEWPNPRLEHWRTLLRARAIENQAFVIGCNRVGGGATSFFGHSLIVDPWGDIIVEGGEAESIVAAEIDLNKVRNVRIRYPFLEDRRSFERVEMRRPLA